MFSTVIKDKLKEIAIEFTIYNNFHLRSTISMTIGCIANKASYLEIAESCV